MILYVPTYSNCGSSKKHHKTTLHLPYKIVLFWSLIQLKLIKSATSHHHQSQEQHDVGQTWLCWLTWAFADWVTQVSGLTPALRSWCALAPFAPFGRSCFQPSLLFQVDLVLLCLLKKNFFLLLFYYGSIHCAEGLLVSSTETLTLAVKLYLQWLWKVMCRKKQQVNNPIKTHKK